MTEGFELPGNDDQDKKRSRAPLSSRQVAAKPEVKRTRIVIEQNAHIPRSGIFLGLNGQSYLIKPGHEVEVPDGVLEVLDNAIESAPLIDPDTLKVVDYTQQLRYPYRLVKRVAA